MLGAPDFTASQIGVRTIVEPNVAQTLVEVDQQGGAETEGKTDAEHQNRLNADEMTSKKPATNPVNINVPQTIAAIRIYG